MLSRFATSSALPRLSLLRSPLTSPLPLSSSVASRSFSLLNTFSDKLADRAVKKQEDTFQEQLEVMLKCDKFTLTYFIQGEGLWEGVGWKAVTILPRGLCNC